MLDHHEQEVLNLSTPYEPVALYFQDSDSVEYVRRDVPCVYRRVDELLTLVLDMDKRELIGFRLKGFKNFYLRQLKPQIGWIHADFLPMISVIERAAELMGKQVFEDEQKEAYRRASALAQEDGVQLRDLPDAA